MADRRPLTKLQYERLAAFRYELRKFLRFSEDAATAAGLPPKQYQALLAIKGFPGRDHVTIGELAERLQIRHHSAVGLVDRLALDQLVIRDVSIEDRRQVHLHLTPRGEEILEALATTHREQLSVIGRELRNLLSPDGESSLP
ncbi:MAG: MarR family transcriptional regulator [Verrucomicrobiales bacterium]|nr:MarR family transcriptional regulator [Verrucomicrobiales bacterium]